LPKTLKKPGIYRAFFPDPICMQGAADDGGSARDKALHIADKAKPEIGTELSTAH
jgi:hypothetical protein